MGEVGATLVGLGSVAMIGALIAACLSPLGMSRAAGTWFVGGCLTVLAGFGLWIVSALRWLL